MLIGFFALLGIDLFNYIRKPLFQHTFYSRQFRKIKKMPESNEKSVENALWNFLRNYQH